MTHISRPHGGLLNLLRALMALALALPLAAQEGTKFPSNLGHEVEQFVISNQMAFHWVDGAMLLSTPGPQFAIAPGAVPPPILIENGSGQIMRSRWTDIHGVDHEVQTFIPPTTNTELYIKRHNALLNQTLQWFPKGYNDPTSPPILRGEARIVRVVQDMVETHSPRDPTSKIPPLKLGDTRRVKDLGKFDQLMRERR